MKNIFSFFITILLFLFTLNTVSYILSTHVYAHSVVQIIKMTPNAFEPSEATIDANSTVIFINQDKVGRWPASNIHPTHDLYPEFDPKHEIAPGESWSFTAGKPGVWKYHDHSNPHIRGVLSVVKEVGDQTNVPPKIDTVLDFIKENLSNLINKLFSLVAGAPLKIPSGEEFKKMDSEAQIQALTNLSKTKDAKAVWLFIQETFKGESGSTGNIHDLAHLAGKLLYERKGVTGISDCTPTFSFGCYHGLLDTAFATSIADLPLAEKECEKVGQVNSGPYGSCIHGIGHGVSSFHQSKDLEKALNECNKLNNGRDFCFDGVFMEFVRSADSQFYKIKDPLYPCNGLEEKYGPLFSLSCGRNQPSVLISRLGMTFDDVVRLCGTSTLNDKFKSSCFDALGFILASSQDTKKIIIGCKQIANSTYQALCFKSAAGELVFQEVPGWQEKSREVCNATPVASRAFCHENLQRLILEYERGGELNLLQNGQNEGEYVRAQMKLCYQVNGRDDCYKKVADLFSKQFDLKKTLSLFAANEGYPEIYSRCHETTHYLSRNEYQKIKSIAQVYAQCDSTCHGGCYHGVLEQHLKDKNLATVQLFVEFPKVCGKSEDFAAPLIFNECQHGLGHAAMFVTDMDVPGSLSLCDTLESQNAQDRCYSGVFMENSSSSTNNDHPGRYVKAEDPLFPCNTLDQKYAKLCYRYQSSYFAIITNHNWKETASLCLTAPDEYHNDCFRTIGTNQVGFTQDPDQMRQNCSLMPTPHFQEVCIQGVISSYSYRFVGDIGKMENFCAKVAKSYQEACFRQIGVSILDWTADKNTALGLCDNLSNSQFTSWCKQAASETS